MPEYTFYRESTGEQRGVFQAMNDPHVYHGKNNDENDWIRVFHVPATSIDSKIDPSRPQDFVEKTGKKRGTIGNLLDVSQELSEKRAEIHGGVDPVKQKFFEDYAKNRKGKKHPLQMKTFENKDFKIEF